MSNKIVGGKAAKQQPGAMNMATRSPHTAAVQEYVELKDGDIYCLCGNDPNYYGFFPCDGHGEMIEPVADEWDNLYVCTLCSRMIDIRTAAVVGVAAYPEPQAVA